MGALWVSSDLLCSALPWTTGLVGYAAGYFQALRKSRSQSAERKRERGELRRSEALLRAINDLPPTGIFVMDCQSEEALFVNSEFYRIWQLEHLKSEVVAGRTNGEQLLSECLSQIDLGAFVAASTAEDFTGGNRIVEDEVPLLDGRTLRRIYGPIQEERSTFAYLYVFEDITERKQAVEELARATQAAKAASQAKSEFLANMSHELRSPLNAILGFTHILKKTALEPEQKESLQIIYRSGEHLLALINDVLDISKIEAGRVVLSKSEFDLYRLLDELQQMFHPMAQEKGLVLEVVRPPVLPQIILSDRLKLRQILINLLSNAVKFTTSGRITLCVEVLARTNLEATSEAQLFTFSVTDTGVGIAPADQTRLFEAFVQTESGLSSHQGTGLGLAISAEYAHLLEGELTVDSAVGEGSTFSLSLSAVPVNAAVEVAELDLRDRQVIGLVPGQAASKILVVDDLSFNCKLLCQLLTNVGFDVRTAENGQAAIAQWQTWQPHLIWMDMRMPKMGGLEATERIKALEQRSPDRRTVILALTASAFEESRAAAIASGCDDFVSKPIQPAKIFEKIAQHLNVQYIYSDMDEAASELSADEPVTPALLAETTGDWRYALTQAVLDLDDEAILRLTDDLPKAQGAIALAVRKCVEELSYKKLLQVLQETEAVSS